MLAHLKIKWVKKMRFKAGVLAGIGEVLISIRLLVASCQTIRTPIRTNQATSCSPPPPFLFAFYSPPPWLTLTDAFVCSSQNYVKTFKTWVWYSCSSQFRKTTLVHCHQIQRSLKLIFKYIRFQVYFRFIICLFTPNSELIRPKFRAS